MTIFATYDQVNGDITGHYSPDVHADFFTKDDHGNTIADPNGPIAGAIELTAGQWDLSQRNKLKVNINSMVLEEVIAPDDQQFLAAKSQKLQQIQAEKNKVCNSGLTIEADGTEFFFDSDESARIAYSEFALQLADDPTFSVKNWKASEGLWVTLDKALYSKIITAGVLLRTRAFNWKKQQDQKVEAIILGDYADLDTALTALDDISVEFS